MSETENNGTTRVTAAEVVATAWDQISDAGISGLTLPGIASRLGVDEQLVRYWYASEYDVLAALVTLRQDAFIEELHIQSLQASTHCERLRNLFSLCVDDYDAILWIELWRYSLRNQAARYFWQQVTNRYVDLVAKMIRDGYTAGEFTEVQATETASALCALVSGLSVQATMKVPTLDADRMFEILILSASRILGANLGAPVRDVQSG